MIKLTIYMSDDEYTNLVNLACAMEFNLGELDAGGALSISGVANVALQNGIADMLPRHQIKVTK